MNVLFRCDSGAAVGMGHVVRCMTLALEMRQGGARVRFACRTLPLHLIPYLRSSGFEVLEMPAELAAADEPAWLREHAGEGLDAVVVDHYDLGTSWEAAMRGIARVVAVIDDLGREHDADLLLDQNYSPGAGRYRGKVPPHCILLLGPSYALLRPEFRAMRGRVRQHTGQIRRLMLFFGGADATNETGKALRALRGMQGRRFAVDVVAGAPNRLREELERETAALEGGVFHYAVDDMASIMLHADLALGAGGSASWERLCLGVPSVLLILAENQAAIVAELAAAGIVRSLGWHDAVDEAAVAAELDHLALHPELVAKMAQKGYELVDGLGAPRVAERLVAVLAAAG